MQCGTLPKYCFLKCFTIMMSYQWHFTVTNSFWLRASSFVCHSYILRRSHLLPDQLPVEHTGLLSHVGQCLLLSSIRATHLVISHTHSYLVGRSMVVGHIPMVHTCSLMCTNHMKMMAHTPAFLLSWVPLVYKWSTAQLDIVRYHTLEQCQ